MVERSDRMKSKVYFTSEITPESIVKIYESLNVELTGNIAVKVHSGEEDNQNYLHPEFMRKIIERVNGTIVECNTAYEGERNTTEKHLKLMENHGWSKYYNVDILDSEDDIVLENKEGAVIKKNFVGAKMPNYDSMLVLSHFKGHPMGGFGGALKNISIGLASSKGKKYIHTSGNENATFEELMNADHDSFLKSMADAAKTIVDFYKDKIVYINVMANMSVDCDCCSVAEDPCMKDIGVLASTDPVALDKACIDLVRNSNDPGKDHFMERVNSRNGLLTIDSAEKLGIGSKDYELINID